MTAELSGAALAHVVREAAAFYAETYGWREGQAAFNALHEVDPDLANEIRGTRLDPFYRDDKLPEFFAAVSMRSYLKESS